MKKIFLGILISLTVLALSGVAVAISNQGAEKSKAPDLEKIEFIHWDKKYAKSEVAAARTPTCYAFLGKIGKTYLKWTTLSVSYVINPRNPQGLAGSFVTSAVSTSAETWDDATSKDLMGSYTVDTAIAYGVQDYKNAIDFGNYPTAGVIAVTTVWYNPATKAIVEFDVRFDTDWTWGDADSNNDGLVDNPNVMDLQNIAIHELGHGVGLGDVYNSACSLVTMYGYSNYGEIIKRTLDAADITGLRTLYDL